MFIPLRIQNHYRRGPFDAVSFHQSLILNEINLKGNEIVLHSITDIGVRVSNSCQLFAPNSEVVIKVHQNKLLFLPYFDLGLGEGGLPLDCFWHNNSPFLRFFLYQNFH
jgi:hypothetical protein